MFVCCECLGGIKDGWGDDETKEEERSFFRVKTKRGSQALYIFGMGGKNEMARMERRGWFRVFWCAEHPWCVCLGLGRAGRTFPFPQVTRSSMRAQCPVARTADSGRSCLQGCLCRSACAVTQRLRRKGQQSQDWGQDKAPCVLEAGASANQPTAKGRLKDVSGKSGCATAVLTC